MSDAEPIRLIVGLGNPGAGYAGTRHNAGFWLVDRLAASSGEGFRAESRFHCEVGVYREGGVQCRMLRPTTYMNLSGQAVAGLAHFYRIPPAAILVIHDELDLPPGTVRVKVGGGHGGHNGLRDIINRLGDRGFARLRVGIGHPGHRDDVVDYVLRKPPAAEREAIDAALDKAIDEMPALVAGQLQAVMNRLHARMD